MKKLILGLAVVSFLTANSAMAQDLFMKDVPSPITNKFKSAFPDAKDIEWEMDGNLFNVEFEVGFSHDHEIWYDSTGKIIRHKEEISEKDLPAAVKESVEKNFKGYNINDAEKITSGKKVTYRMELDALMKDEWEVAMDENGNILKKRRD